MKKFFLIYLIFFLTLLIPQVILAKNINLQVPIGTHTFVTDLTDYIRIFYQFFVTSAGALSTVMIVYGGFNWLTAGGNSQKIGEAKETITSAIFGLVLALVSYALLNTINPSITSLEHIGVPPVPLLEQAGKAKRLCDFNKEINVAKNEPVHCGEAIQPDSQKPSDWCMGTNSKNNDNYCMVTSSAGSMSGTEMSSITVNSHPSKETHFDVNNGPDLPQKDRACGIMWWNNGVWSFRYEVGMVCEPKLAAGDPTKYYNTRCYLDGPTGQFQSDPSIPECSGVPEEYKSGCGRITNMKCKD